MATKGSVYVAGKVGAGTDSVKHLLTQLEDMGYEVAYDWTEATGVKKPYLENALRNRPFAEKMLQGAGSSNIIILLVQDNILGALIEFGIALGNSLMEANFRAFVVTEGVETLRESIFYCLEEVTIVDTVDELLTLLKD